MSTACADKIPYESELAARDALALIRPTRQRGRRTEQRVYLCHICLCYHLTAQPRRKKALGRGGTA